MHSCWTKALALSLLCKKDKRVIDRHRQTVGVLLLDRTFQRLCTDWTLQAGSLWQPSVVVFFTNLSNIAAFGGNESPGCVREKDRLLGRNTQQPCSEQFVSIKKKPASTGGSVNKSKPDRTSYMPDAHVHFVISCSHLIKQRLLCNLWVVRFPWQPHVLWS